MPELRSGMAIKYEGELYWVVDFQHIHMGRGGATIRTKLKNIKTGRVREVSLRESDDVEEVRVERKFAQFSYTSGDEYHFLDSETYEDIPFHRSQIEDHLGYLKEEMEVTILWAEGVPIGIELPNFVELKVVETEPGVRGDTVSGGSKPAKLETGKVIQVPLFVDVGDVVRVDTRTDRYIERVK
jgi:elongation factor P